MVEEDLDNISYYKDLYYGPVLLLGNGPSLNFLDPNKLTMNTIGIHRSWRVVSSIYHVILRSVPRTESWTNHWKEFSELPSYRRPDHIFTSDIRGPEIVPLPRHRIVTRVMDKTIEFSMDLSKGSGYYNAGILALEVAVWMGFNPIYLIGYDMNFDEGNFEDPKAIIKPDVRILQRDLMQTAANKLRSHREVYNCSMSSSLTCFPRADLETCYR